MRFAKTMLIGLFGLLAFSLGLILSPNKDSQIILAQPMTEIPSLFTNAIAEEPKLVINIVAREEELRPEPKNTRSDVPVALPSGRLSKKLGAVQGPTGKETYYNLPMHGVVATMRRIGYSEEEYPYWIREDGCKMLGDYIICAANLQKYPRGSFVESSLGTCIVADTGTFALHNPNQLDLATTW